MTEYDINPQPPSQPENDPTESQRSGSQQDEAFWGRDSDVGPQRTLPAARGDVELAEQVYDGKPCYVLKDPVSLRYYRLRPPEHAIFTMLDGHHTMDDVLKVLQERFPNEQFDQQAVMSFLIMLRSANLLNIPGESDTEFLLQRKQKLTRSLFDRLRKEFLFFRIPLMDPDRILNVLNRGLGNILYTRTAAVIAWLILIGAVVMLIDNIDKLHDRQPLLSWINLLYLGPSLFLIKIVHEFGHGLTSKRFGTEVHEMGILFLVFMPCMYCDVSDAWMIPNKSRRMWITAAGIVIELMLAALATYVWALTEARTVINQFALNVMIVGSLNTLMFNGNPLLRYDGYYFLMDLMEMPNLKQKSTGYLWYLFQRYVLGVESAKKPLDVEGREAGVLGYGIASGIYRWFIMFLITATVYTFLEPYGLGFVGAIMALGCLYNALVAPLVRFGQFLVQHHHRLHVRPLVTVLTILLMAGAVYGILILEVEQTVEAPCVLRPSDMHVLYVTQPGFVPAEPTAPLIHDGQQVTQGQVLLTLNDPELETQLHDIELELDQLELQKSLATQTGKTDKVIEINGKIKGRRAQLDRLKSQVQRLSLCAPIDGVVHVLSDKPLEDLRGAFLARATSVLAVVAPGRFDAVAAVGEGDNGLIESGNAVRIKLWSYDGRELTSTVVSKPPDPVRRMSSPAFSTAFGGEVPTLPAAESDQALIPAKTTYEYELPLDADLTLRDGMVGRAQFIIARKTLARTFYRWLVGTLRLDIRL